jgi:5-methylthioadenosine/S-adenosylhomocysteine deaminase
MPRALLNRLLLVACLLPLCLTPLPIQAMPQKRHVDLLVVGGTVVTMDAERRVIENGTVAIDGDTVVAIGPRADLETRFIPSRRLDAAGKLVLPGLINGHTHAAMTLLRGLADDASLHDWLNNYIFPAEARNVTPDFVIWGTRLADLEMIHCGATTYADMYYFEEDVARETRAAGMRGILAETIIGFPAPDNKDFDHALAYTEKFLNHWKGDPLIHAAVGPHSVYTCSKDLLTASADLARRHHAPILIHLSESKPELDESRAKYGVSPVAYLDKLGILGADVLAAHCIWVDGHDVALLARRDVGCVHNPSSNMLLASGVAPVTQMIAAGVRLGLGTDGSAGGNHDLDLMEEMPLAAALQKVTHNNPQALLAEQAFAMATIDGARALHMENQIGSLEPGKKADLVLLNLNTPDGVPLYNVYSQIVYSLRARDVETVVIGGRMVMENRRVLTIDEAEVLRKAREYSARVRKSLDLR